MSERSDFKSAIFHWLEGYRCPDCGSEKSTCKDSRKTEGGIRRRRECNKCKRRWNSHEVSDEAFGLFQEIGLLAQESEELITALKGNIGKIRSILNLAHLEVAEGPVLALSDEEKAA